MEPEPKDDKGLTETEEWELERKLIDLAFYNSYVILTNKLTYEEFALSNHKKGISSVIFHDPHEGPSSEDIKDMTKVEDFRSENILFDGDRAITVDWQTQSESSVMTDAAYFLGGSVEVEDRRIWEKELIEQYRDQLAHYGVELSFQDCWDQYREYAMHGLMISVLGARAD